MVDLSMSQARMRLSALVRRAASDHERTTITDHGEPAAVLVNAEELADLEESVALSEYQARRASGEQRMIPHAEAMRRLSREPGGSMGANTPLA